VFHVAVKQIADGDGLFIVER